MNRKDMKMKDLCADERPMEKMRDKGVFSLSNAELIAILLGSGTRSMNAVDVARELLKSGGEQLGAVSSMSLDALKGISGIGKNKAARVTAAFELGRRCAAEEATGGTCRLNSSDSVFRIMYPQMKNLKREECWLIMLNRANVLIYKEQISIGGEDSTAIDYKAIAIRCLEKKASAAILVHNHPSGTPIPSKADIEVTNLIRKTLATCGVNLLDHVIISPGSWYSFADEVVTVKNCREKFCKGEK